MFCFFSWGEKQGIKHHLFLDSEQSIENSESKNGPGGLVYDTEGLGKPFA